MLDGIFTATAVINALLLLASVYLYLSLVRQIGRKQELASSEGEIAKGFGWPDALVVSGLAAFLLYSTATGSTAESKVILQTRDLILNVLVSVGLVVFISSFLTFRGINLGSAAGFARLNFLRILATGIVLLLAAYQLVVLADLLTKRFFEGSDSMQEIVELFNGSQSLTQRVIIIVLAVVVAPMVEEFFFRFYLYGVAKRYLGFFAALLINSALFAAVHHYLPAAAPLFVLALCLTIAYEWSGSILVSMTMHSVFNSLTLISLAFPDTFPQR